MDNALNNSYVTFERGRNKRARKTWDLSARGKIVHDCGLLLLPRYSPPPLPFSWKIGIIHVRLQHNTYIPPLCICTVQTPALQQLVSTWKISVFDLRIGFENVRIRFHGKYNCRKKKRGGGKIGDLFSPILFFLEGLENNRETIFPPPHPERTPTN